MAQTPSFYSVATHGFIRVAAATPIVHPADPVANAGAHLDLIRQAGAQGVDLLAFPELSLTGYAIDDLLLQDALLDAAEAQLQRLAEAAGEAGLVAVVGAPIRSGDRLYNCAVVLANGAILGAVPKTYLPNYREYYEKRWFAPADDSLEPAVAFIGKRRITVDARLLFQDLNRPGFRFGVEICEDYWAPLPPSTRQALAGARILVNLSASNVLIGKSDERDRLSSAQSARAMAAYVFTASGWGESTTDLAWDGQSTIHELGQRLAHNERFALKPALTVADVDVDRIGLDRLRTGTFADCARRELAGRSYQVVGFTSQIAQTQDLKRTLDRFPFVPDDAARLDQDCFEAFNIQVQGLMKRLTATGLDRIVIGVSGGLDSTLALLVACRAFDRLGIDRKNILAFTMPGFATSEGTKSNALALMEALGVSGDEIDIRPTAETMLKEIGHPFAEGRPVYDITFENVQAGLRTDYLFRIANQRGGIVLGTGDLSELALGWCTYGVGDHMSHYNVNGGVAKTLVKHLIRWVAERGEVGEDASQTLRRVLDTVISPELVPGQAGEVQSSEAKVGPYALNDFFLFHITRYGFAPSKVAWLCWQAWRDADVGAWPVGTPDDEKVAYDLKTIRHWLEKFLVRFFQTSQFKRSALPNGPKVVSGGSLSPRGDWRAPSDSSAKVWLDELRANCPEG